LNHVWPTRLGAVQCTGYIDSVTFGGLTVNNFTFGSCFNEVSFTYPERYNSPLTTHFSPSSIGVIGIGIPDPKSPAQNWIVQAYDQGLIPAPAYSLVLGRTQPSSTGFTDGSLLVIGGYDTDLVQGDIATFACSGSTHFQIALDAIILNGVTIMRSDGKPMRAIIDVHCSPSFPLPPPLSLN
jgi:hypothetical protein